MSNEKKLTLVKLRLNCGIEYCSSKILKSLVTCLKSHSRKSLNVNQAYNSIVYSNETILFGKMEW